MCCFDLIWRAYDFVLTFFFLFSLFLFTWCFWFCVDLLNFVFVVFVHFFVLFLISSFFVVVVFFCRNNSACKRMSWTCCIQPVQHLCICSSVLIFTRCLIYAFFFVLMRLIIHTNIISLLKFVPFMFIITLENRFIHFSVGEQEKKSRQASKQIRMQTNQNKLKLNKL